MNNRPSKTQPLKANGRTVGTVTINDDASLTYDITDETIREQLNRHVLGNFSVGPVSTEDVLKASRWLNGEAEPEPKPTIYIAGPMTGHQGYNYDAFNNAAADLRAAGYHVLNPADNPKPNPDPSWQDWMRAALGQLIQADAIALLDGWDTSRGAQVEQRLAENLGLDIRHIGNWLPAPVHLNRYAPAPRTTPAPTDGITITNCTITGGDSTEGIGFNFRDISSEANHRTRLDGNGAGTTIIDARRIPGGYTGHLPDGRPIVVAITGDENINFRHQAGTE